MIMDNNVNQAIIRKLARRSRRSNQIRNGFACLTIALSEALVFAFLLYLDGTQTEKLRQQAESTHVTYETITLSQLTQLRSDNQVTWAGGELIVGKRKIGTVHLMVAWMDKENLKKDKIFYTGAFPSGEMDIMVSQEYLELLAEEPGLSENVKATEGLNVTKESKPVKTVQPGDSLRLNLGDGVMRNYRISAIYHKPSRTKKSQRIYVSLPCATMLLGEEYEPGEEKINAIVSLQGAVGMKPEEATEVAAGIAARAGISEEQVKLNDLFFTMTTLSKLTRGDYLTFLLVTLLILVAAGIVIHTIFYISIAGRVREYGQLRTIGMTKRQVKRLVLREGITLAGYGSLNGLLAGGILGYVLVPAGFDLVRCLCAAALCYLLAIAVVLLSLWKPGSIAASTSPIAALSYSGYTKTRPLKWQPATSNSQPLTPDYLAVIALKRNRTKRFLTLFSLVLSGILLGTITSYVASYDPIASVRISFPNGEYQLMISPSSGFGSDNSLEGRMKIQSQLQADGLFGKELQEELSTLKGVASTIPWRLLFGSTSLFEEQTEEKNALYINGISEEDFALLEQTSYQGPSSYEELLQKPGLIVNNSYHIKLQEYPLSIGDLVPFTFYDGTGTLREELLPVIAIVDLTEWKQKNRTNTLPLSLYGSSFMMSNSTLDQFAGMNTTYGYEIAVEPKQDRAVGEALEELYGAEENLSLSSKAEDAAYYQKEYRSTQIILYSLALFLVLFGVINLTNTLFTSLYSRKRELGILQAVGMTEKQLRRMFSRETAHYTVISAFCALVPGGLLGYALVMMQLLLGMDITYAYPWLPILSYILVLFLCQKGITHYGVTLLQKESLVERMKTV